MIVIMILIIIAAGIYIATRGIDATSQAPTRGIGIASSTRSTAPAARTDRRAFDLIISDR